MPIPSENKNFLLSFWITKTFSYSLRTDSKGWRRQFDSTLPHLAPAALIHPEIAANTGP
jgi:hypothetical protein